MSLLDALKTRFGWKVYEPIDRYHIASVTNPNELLRLPDLPLEFQYVITKNPDRMLELRQLLERGYGVGIRTVEYTPERLLLAIDRISQRTQENTIIPWLPRLLREGELPAFTEFELRTAEKEGINLYEEAKLILEHRYEFKKFVAIDLQNKGVSHAERELLMELNQELYPLAVDYIVNRVLFDNAHARTEVAQSIIKALLFIGPIAHVLELWLHGLGKLFAASADDLLGETAELFALRGSGFTWRELIRRSKLLVPVFALATYGAFRVEPLINQGKIGWAGAVFGLSAVSLSLTTAIQSIFLYKRCYARLRRMTKISPSTKQSDFALAFRQDFTNPARLGLLVGVLCSPFLAAIVFILFTPLVHNGWVLALLGSAECICAGLTVISAKRINRFKFRRGVKKALGQLMRKT